LRSLGNGLVAIHVFATDTAETTNIRSAVYVAAARLFDSQAASRAPPVLL
jgi:hypothetical protein